MRSSTPANEILQTFHKVHPSYPAAWSLEMKSLLRKVNEQCMHKQCSERQASMSLLLRLLLTTSEALCYFAWHGMIRSLKFETLFFLWEDNYLYLTPQLCLCRILIRGSLSLLQSYLHSAAVELWLSSEIVIQKLKLICGIVVLWSIWSTNVKTYIAMCHLKWLIPHIMQMLVFGCLHLM